MKSEKKAQPSESPKDKEAKLAVVQQHPELLMAAQEGDSARLNAILGNAAAGTTPTAAHAGPPGVTIDIIVEEADDVDKATGMTISTELELHNVLHVVASSGDSPTFLENARIIHGKAKHLLDARNQKGDTPFHCAARAGMVTMVTQLISLAEAEGGGDRVKLALRKQNKRRETALHEALRFADKETVWAMVNKLMAADAELARFPPANGTSPLYLAVSLGHDDIAERLHELDQGLSYCGPNGQNVLHVAVLRCTSMTNSLLKWNNDLSKQGEQTNGSTPLHFAAFHGICERVELLLDTDKSLAYQCDNKGSFAIHEAVRGMQVYACRPWLHVVRTLLKKCPDCAQLRDAEGKTFLHVAAERDYAYQLRYRVLRGLRGKQQFAFIMNMQDNDGNTGLHLAVMAGGLRTLFALLMDKEVLLNLSNNKGQTALDLSQRNRPAGVFFGLDPRVSIDNLLKAAGAQYSAHIETHVPRLDEKEESTKISDSTPTIGVVSVLLVTISFAAAFTIPGGYRTEDDPNVLNIKGGTPVLVTSNSFQAFIIANNLALLCSTMATISLMYAGVPTVDIRTRMTAFVLSIFFLNTSARTLAAAFALGMYATLAPAAPAAATLTIIGTAITLLDLGWVVYKISTQKLVLRNRLGVSVALLRFACSVLSALLTCLWPYVIIASFLAYMKHHA